MPVRRLGYCAVVLSLVASVSCARQDDGSQLNEQRDDFGAMLPASLRAERIVSLGPGTTEIVVALGAFPRLVGRSMWDKWPEAVQRVEEVGDALRPSVERVLAMRPDLVLMYASPDNKPAASLLVAANVPVVALRVDRIEEFLRAITILGSLLQEEARADSLNRGLKTVVDSLRAVRNDSGPRVFIPVWNAPLMTVGSGSFLSELIEIAGATNVYGHRRESAFVVSPEDLSQRDPDIILVGPAGRAEWAPGGRWGALRAVKEGRVAVYDTTLVGQPSLRMGLAAISLTQLFDSVTHR